MQTNCCGVFFSLRFGFINLLLSERFVFKFVWSRLFIQRKKPPHFMKWLSIFLNFNAWIFQKPKQLAGLQLVLKMTFICWLIRLISGFNIHCMLSIDWRHFVILMADFRAMFKNRRMHMCVSMQTNQLFIATSTATQPCEMCVISQIALVFMTRKRLAGKIVCE